MNGYDETRQLSPVRVAPLSESNAYTVHEHELDIIAAGSPTSLAFNLAIALLSVGASFLLTITTTTIGPDRLFYSYLIVCINCLMVGLIAPIYWLRTRTSVNALVIKVKSHLVAPMPIQEPMPTNLGPPERMP